MFKESLQIDFEFIEDLEKIGPFQTGACFQCRKCSNGCPVTFAMDLHPNEVIRMVLLGQRAAVLSCRTIWVCASCETCTTRCPNNIKIAELMDCLKEMSVKEGVPSAIPEILTLHKTFLSSINRYGRVFEGGLLPEYFIRSKQLISKLMTGSWRGDLTLGIKLLIKGRVSLFPKMIKGRSEVRKILSNSKKSKIKS